MITLVTYNIFFHDILFQERHQQLLETLQKTDADVICLQEVLPEAASFLLKHLMGYRAAIKPMNRVYGEMILVKDDIELLSTKIIKLPSKMGRVLNLAQLKKGALVFNVLTFHLESLNNAETRLEQEEILAKTIATLPYTIACGDTNIKAREKQLRPINFRDAWVLAGQPPEGLYTYHASRFWGSDTRERYDRVWISGEWSMLDFKMLGKHIIPQIKTWISDHDGIQVELGV